MVRVHSRRSESRRAFAERLERDLRRHVQAVDSWEQCVRDADVVVEATRLVKAQPLLRTEWIAKGALVVAYGTVSALELTLTDIMDKIVVDDWGQAHAGPLGALRAHVDSGRLSEANLYAELGEVVCGAKPGRETPNETILFWHRGLSLSDIALGHALLEKARRLQLGTRLTTGTSILTRADHPAPARWPLAFSLSGRRNRRARSGMAVPASRAPGNDTDLELASTASAPWSSSPRREPRRPPTRTAIALGPPNVSCPAVDCLSGRRTSLLGTRDKLQHELDATLDAPDQVQPSRAAIRRLNRWPSCLGASRRNRRSEWHCDRT